MISANPAQRTAVQNFGFEKIKKNYLALESQMATHLKATVLSAEDLEKKQTDAHIADLQTIIDIQYDSKNKKVLIEIEKHGVEEFNFLLTEQHVLLSLALEKKNIHLFGKHMKTPYVWTTFNYDVAYAPQVQFQVSNSSFFMVFDSDREFTTDNWVHCLLTNKTLQVSSFQPYSQLMNPGFEKFASERIQQQINAQVGFIQIKQLKDITVSTVAATYETSYLQLKAAALIPNFSFWTDGQIDAFLHTQTLKKMSKVIAQLNAAQAAAAQTGVNP
jgi:hypothetical protein